MTAMRCLPIEEIHRALELPAGDPRLAHIRECPRCRALADQFRAFVEARAEGIPESRLAEAGARLRTAMDQEIAASALRTASTERGEARAAASPPPRREGTGSWWNTWLTPAWKPALAFAALAVFAAGTVMWSGNATRTGESALRGAPGASGLALLGAERTAQGVSLRWEPWNGADGYEVRLYTDRLDEIGRIPCADASLVLTADQLPQGRALPERLLVRVVALNGGDEIAISDVQIIERP